MDMRKLKATDVFKMIKIMNKVGVTKALKKMTQGDLGDELRDIFTKKNEESETAFEHAGMLIFAHVAEIVMNEVEKAEKEINEFLAELTSTSKKEIEDLSMHEYTALIVNFFKKEELRSFFGQLLPLIR